MIRALARACQDFGADAVEGLALFEAAIVASNLRADLDETDGRVGALAQNPMWGPAVARRDPYTAATVFLRQARRVRTGDDAPRTAAGLATRVLGEPGAWRHARARGRARDLLADFAVDRPVDETSGDLTTLIAPA